MNIATKAAKLIKTLGLHKHLAIKQQLQEDYPDQDWNIIIEAYSRAEDMFRRASELAFEYRDKKFSEIEAMTKLRNDFPEFKEAILKEAWAAGLFESMW